MCVTIRTKLEKPCKLWTGCTQKGGYGSRKYKGRNEKAHRVAYVEANGLTMGDIEGVTIRHKCDVRACIEPTHLESGTRAQNMKDMVQRGRSLKGEKQPNSKLTTEQVREIRQHIASGQTYRVIASEFGLAISTISNIKNRKKWSHV